MAKKGENPWKALRDWLAMLVLSLPWPELLGQVWRAVQRLTQQMAGEGMYEVLEHEASLELLNGRGEWAKVHKRQKVRYLQDYVVAYLDQAWGDGEILIDYHCTPGKVVDRWRPGQRTFQLISLRETKRRGEVDDLKISWKIRKGFRRTNELWETEIQHWTRQLRLQVIFPKTRPPERVWLVEKVAGRKHQLGQEAFRAHSGGRWLVSWETKRPRLNERYQLQWEW